MNALTVFAIGLIVGLAIAGRSKGNYRGGGGYQPRKNDGPFVFPPGPRPKGHKENGR